VFNAVCSLKQLKTFATIEVQVALEIATICTKKYHVKEIDNSNDNDNNS
jgi:hypothetical protein